MMKKSSIFYTDKYKDIEQKTKDFLNGYGDVCARRQN